ncbi:MAG TPA: mandelate racemase/muconate lactonizing enzyme family protein [Vineibacter sp.]|nr:mandelate racemase/muconate lactonizing enzyme family protein [Vineibacter sp.]
MGQTRVESVDFFYVAMPVIEDIGDGSQDACVVRVTAGGHEGWGECEAAPLPSIAAYVCPMSHSACHPVSASVLGERLETPEDIRRINATVRARSADSLQSAHTLSGIDMALWDLLGRLRDEPAWKLLGYATAYPKLPYASALFGDTPEATLAKARVIRAQGYRAAKFGWGPFGWRDARDDSDQLVAAREGLGQDAKLLVDAGTVWVDDVERAKKSLPALQAVNATWLEEPFISSALGAYGALARHSGAVRLAGGEGAHDWHLARNMIDYGSIGFVQIDAGRVGGLTDAKRVADYAQAKGVTFVNHSFQSQLALSASIQPFAGIEKDELCEYPVEARDVAYAITRERLERGADGLVRLPDKPGLGLTVDPQRFKPYLLDVEIKVGGSVLYRTPSI